MNYYEYRLQEIRHEISLLRGHPLTEEVIHELELERDQILQEIGDD